MIIVQIKVDKDYVQIEGQLITRPVNVGRLVWMEYWGEVREFSEGGESIDQAYDRGYDRGQEDMKVAEQ